MERISLDVIAERLGTTTPIHGDITEISTETRNLPEGCLFAPRCPYATEECRKDKPPLTSFGSERKVRCYHALVK